MKYNALFLVLAVSALAQSEAPSGRWDGTIVYGDLKIPFSMQLELSQGAVSGAFVNGDEKVASTAGTFRGGDLRLTFGQYGTTLDAKITNDALKGKYGGTKFGTYDLEGGVFCTCGSEGEAGPDISGTWSVEPGSASRLVVERKGEDTIVRLYHPEDIHGAHFGRFDGLAFMLHHFDGGRASLLEIEPRKDGSLDLTLREPRGVVKKFHAVKK